MADIKVALAEIKQESESGSGVSVAVPRRKSRLWLAGLIALALMAAAVAWLRFGPHETEPPAPASRIVPLTSFSALEGSPVFSPDGKQVAFMWNGEKGDNWDVYVKLIDAGTPLRLTRDPAADWSPAWSPDGRQIATHTRCRWISKTVCAPRR